MGKNAPSPFIRIIRKPAVCERVGCSDTQVDNIERDDPTFPRRVKIGPRSVGWVESEVNAWLEARVAASRSPGAKKPKPFGRHAKRPSDATETTAPK